MNKHLESLIAQAKPKRSVIDAIAAGEACHNSMGLGYEGDDCNGYYDAMNHAGCCPRKSRPRERKRCVLSGVARCA